MEWYYLGKPIEFGEGELDPKKIYGFVYVIRNLLNGRKYIGKKFFWSKRTMVRKGKKLKSTIESDWRKYCGSNGPLLEDIKEFGAENFEKEIIHLCASKSECAYLEAKEQFAIDAILDKDFYNDWISVKTTRRHLMKYAAKKNVQVPENMVE
jgi:hypothetical protein